MLPLLEKRHEMFREVFGGTPPLPNPFFEGNGTTLTKRPDANGASMDDQADFGIATDSYLQPPIPSACRERNGPLSEPASHRHNLPNDLSIPASEFFPFVNSCSIGVNHQSVILLAAASA